MMQFYDFCVYCYWMLISKDWMDIRNVCGGNNCSLGIAFEKMFWRTVCRNCVMLLLMLPLRMFTLRLCDGLHVHIYITYTYGYKCVCSSGMVWTVKMKFMYRCMGHMNDVKGIGWLFSIDLQQMFGGSSYWPPVVWWFYGIAIQHAVLQIVILIKMSNNQNNNNHHHEQQQQQQQHQEHCHHHVYIIHVYI